MLHDPISYNPFGHLDCQENPYDLRPMVRRIMEAESSILDRLPPDRQLVIIMGEHHGAQGHMLLQKAVFMAHEKLRGESDAGNFAVGAEYSHDYIARYTGKEIDDPHGHEAIEVRRHYYMGCAYAAHKDVLDYCVDKKISVSFNDAACRNEIIDYNEPFTREIVRRYSPGMLERGPVNRGGDPRGIAISNLCMVEKSIEHINRTQARVYLHTCGQAHVLGASDTNYPFEESLSARFLERGFEILPVICNYEMAQHYIPAEAERLFSQSILLSHNEYGSEEILFKDLRRAIGFQSGLDL